MRNRFKPVLKNAARAVVILSSVATTSAYALDKIYDPYVNKGEAEIEYSGYRTSDSDKTKNDAQGHEIEFGYAWTDYWELEFSGIFERGPDQPMQMNGAQIENKFQLFEPGEMWADAGLLLSYTRALHENDADSLEVKLLVQKDIGKFSSLANIGLEQGIGDENRGGPDFTFLWNNRYRMNEYFQPGIEIQSDFGQTNVHEHFNQQQQLVGPSAYGKLFGGKELGDVGYEAAYLFGVTNASPSGAARLMLEYEMHF